MRSWPWYALEACRLALAATFCAAVIAIADGRLSIFLGA